MFGGKKHNVDIDRLREIAISNLEVSSGGTWRVDANGELYTFISLNAPSYYERPYDGFSAGSTKEHEKFHYAVQDLSESEAYRRSFTWSADMLTEPGSTHEDSGYYKFKLALKPDATEEQVKADAQKMGAVLKPYTDNYRDAALNHRLPRNVLDEVIERVSPRIDPKSRGRSPNPD